jgi:hypothetical protein
MATIIDSLKRFFDEDDWTYSEMEIGDALHLGFSGTDGQWNCYAQAREEPRQAVFYSVLPIRVPEDRRLAVAEFITRANYGMILGNFELDLSDGEVRFKTSIDVEGHELEPTLVKHIVYANVSMMDRYMRGILAVAHSDADPGRIVTEIEGERPV